MTYIVKVERVVKTMYVLTYEVDSKEHLDELDEYGELVNEDLVDSDFDMEDKIISVEEK